MMYINGISREEEALDGMVTRILEADSDPVIITIDGMSGSGKSTLGQKLHQRYGGNLFHMDDFFLRPFQRTKERMAEVGGNVDYERFFTEVIEQLPNPSGLTYQKYSCREQRLTEKVFVEYQRLTIIEGAYSQHPYFGVSSRLAVVLIVPKELQRERILKRNGAEQLKRFVEEWIPKENEYLEVCLGILPEG